MWIEITPGWQSGEGLTPYTGETAHMLDWVENPTGQSRHRFAHNGQFIVDLVEIEPNAVHQLGKPGDEIVIVVSGTLELITDATQVKQTFHPGEVVLFKAGWAGIYRVNSEHGPFREFAIVPGNYFDACKAPPVDRETPVQLDLPSAIGMHELSRGTYLVELQTNDRDVTWSIAPDSDSLICLLAGSCKLTSRDDSAVLNAGSAVVLPKGFIGEISAAADYRALIIRWNG